MNAGRLGPIVYRAAVESANGDATDATLRRVRAERDAFAARIRAARRLIDAADPQAGPGHTAVLLGQLRTVLGRPTDPYRSVDAALADISAQKPGAPPAASRQT